jgi:hypothetical protein
MLRASQIEQEVAMTHSHPSLFLRRALLADALVSGATGLMMLFGAGLTHGLLGLPEALLREAGIVLLPYAALVGFVGTRERFPMPAVWAVIVCNAVWAAGSILLLVSGLVTPKLLGYAFVVAQAVAVALFAELQYVGLRRVSAAAA